MYMHEVKCSDLGARLLFFKPYEKSSECLLGARWHDYTSQRFFSVENIRRVARGEIGRPDGRLPNPYFSFCPFGFPLSCPSFLETKVKEKSQKRKSYQTVTKALENRDLTFSFLYSWGLAWYLAYNWCGLDNF